VTTSAGTRTSTFDARNRITQTTGAGGPTDTYTWNPRGQLTGSVRASKTYSYTYDGFERLTQVTGTSLTTSTYTYDSLDRAAQRNTANFGYNDTSNNPVLSPAAAGETKMLRDPLGTLLASKTGTAASVLNVDDRCTATSPPTSTRAPATRRSPPRTTRGARRPAPARCRWATRAATPTRRSA
jgi:YD repeat-containing protein